MPGASHCSTCGAPIRWIKMHSGNYLPLDKEPVEGGNIILVMHEGKEYGHVLSKELMERTELVCPRYVSHFATCPDAKKHRKGK